MNSPNRFDIDFWNIELLDTDLNLLETGIPSKHFEDVMKDEKFLHWRRVEEVFKTTWIPTNVYKEGLENAQLCSECESVMLHSKVIETLVNRMEVEDKSDFTRYIIISAILDFF